MGQKLGRCIKNSDFRLLTWAWAVPGFETLTLQSACAAQTVSPKLKEFLSFTLQKNLMMNLV